jgi:hypothetical protein
VSSPRNKRPAEIFGYLFTDTSSVAQMARARRWCPFTDSPCRKRSRLIDYPFGICSVEWNGSYHITCPVRFAAAENNDDIPAILVDIAQHYFGDLDNLIAFPEVRLPHVGSIDFVLVRHKPMQPIVEDFVAVEIQADSTTGTGKLVQAIEDFFKGKELLTVDYAFGMNTYDTIKRAITQLLNKGIVYEAWNTKCYWVLQEYIFDNIGERYGFKKGGFSEEDATRLILYNFVKEGQQLCLIPTRVVSTSVEEVFHAMRVNPGLPDKDSFVQRLNEKLQAQLTVQFR